MGRELTRRAEGILVPASASACGLGVDQTQYCREGVGWVGQFWSLFEGNTFHDLVWRKGSKGSPFLAFEARNSFLVLERVAGVFLVHEEEA